MLIVCVRAESGMNGKNSNKQPNLKLLFPTEYTFSNDLGFFSL